MKSKTFKQLEKIIRTKPILRFKETSVKFKDYEDVINFALLLRPTGKTIRKKHPYWDSYHDEKQYYENSTIFKTTDNIQCLSNKRRGLYDLYRIVLHYFPKTTFKEVYNVVGKQSSTDCDSTNQHTFRWLNEGNEIPRNLTIRIGKDKYLIKEN